MNVKTVQLYHRWVDDIFVRCKRVDIDKIHQKLNSFCKNIQFTVDEGTKIDKNRTRLAFLDISVEFGGGMATTTSVYRKPTTSSIVYPYSVHAPRQWKEGTLIFYIRRAVTHSSDYKIMHTEINLLKKSSVNFLDVLKYLYNDQLVVVNTRCKRGLQRLKFFTTSGHSL